MRLARIFKRNNIEFWSERLKTVQEDTSPLVISFRKRIFPLPISRLDFHQKRGPPLLFSSAAFVTYLKR